MVLYCYILGYAVILLYAGRKLNVHNEFKRRPLDLF